MSNEDILLRLIQLKPNLTKTRLMKLMYLFDLAFIQLSGKQKTTFKYKWWKHGPYCHDIEETIIDLQVDDKIDTKQHLTKEGHDCLLYVPLKKQIHKLSEPEEKVLHYIVKQYANRNFNDLLNFVYDTPPMKEARKNKARGRSLNLHTTTKQTAAFYIPEIAKMILESEFNLNQGKRISLDKVLQKIGA